jgi:hypothetical protein
MEVDVELVLGYHLIEMRRFLLPLQKNVLLLGELIIPCLNPCLKRGQALHLGSDPWLPLETSWASRERASCSVWSFVTSEESWAWLVDKRQAISTSRAAIPVDHSFNPEAQPKAPSQGPTMPHGPYQRAHGERAASPVNHLGSPQWRAVHEDQGRSP